MKQRFIGLMLVLASFVGLVALPTTPVKVEASSGCYSAYNNSLTPPQAWAWCGTLNPYFSGGSSGEKLHVKWQCSDRPGVWNSGNYTFSPATESPHAVCLGGATVTNTQWETATWTPSTVWPSGIWYVEWTDGAGHGGGRAAPNTDGISNGARLKVLVECGSGHFHYGNEVSAPNYWSSYTCNTSIGDAANATGVWFVMYWP